MKFHVYDPRTRDTACARTSSLDCASRDVRFTAFPRTFRPSAAPAVRSAEISPSPTPTRNTRSISVSSCRTGISKSSPALPVGEKNETSSTRDISKNFSIDLSSELLPIKVTTPSLLLLNPSARSSLSSIEESSGST